MDSYIVATQHDKHSHSTDLGLASQPGFYSKNALADNPNQPGIDVDVQDLRIPRIASLECFSQLSSRRRRAWLSKHVYQS